MTTFRAFFRIPEVWLLMAVVAILLALAFLPVTAHANGSEHHNSDVTVENDNRSEVDVDSHDVYRGDDYEASAASAMLYLNGCGQGASAQGVGFGAALGGESRVCQLLRVAAAHQALGMHYEASVIVRQAIAEINGGGVRPEEGAPLARLSRFLRFHLVQPLFGWLPFVGHAV